jgi:sugar (pentulose or hexulose) kinase
VGGGARVGRRAREPRAAALPRRHAAVGAGAAGAGDVLDSCGTAEAWVRASAPIPRERIRRATDGGISVGWHAVAGHHALLGSVRSGAVLQAVLDLLGVPAGARDELEAAALDADPGGLELAGFKGEGLTISGLTAGASPAALYRAALESLGAAGAEIMARMEAVAGRARRLVVTGGWAAGAAARAVKQRHLGRFEYVPEISTGARGAALAAGRAAAVLEVA